MGLSKRHLRVSVVAVFLQCGLPTAGKASADQTLNYVVSWNGIPAARATVQVSESPVVDSAPTRLDASISTSALVDLFWSLRAESWGEVNPTTLGPLGFEYRRRINGRPEDTRIDVEDGELTGRYSRPGRYHLIAVADQGAVDPIAAVLQVRQAQLLPGAPSSYDVFTGEARYRIVLQPRGTELLSVPAGHFTALRIEPAIWRIDEHQRESRVRDLTLWVTASLPHTLLRVRSKVFIGAIYVDLVSALPAELR